MVSPIMERCQEEVSASDLFTLKSNKEADTAKLTGLEKVDRSKDDAGIDDLSQEEIENNSILVKVHNYTFPFKISTPFPLSPLKEAAHLDNSLSDISTFIQDTQTQSAQQNCFDDRTKVVRNDDGSVTSVFPNTSDKSPLNMKEHTLLDSLNISSLTDTSDDDLQYKIQLITPFIEEHESLLSEMNKVMILYNCNVDCF